MAEVGNMTIEDARALVSNRSLWPHVRDFLWNFAPSIHESWIADKFGDQASRHPALLASGRTGRFILDSLGVEPCFHTFPADDGSRILLLDGTTLESVVKWLGALACADALRRVTSGTAVRELKSSLSGVYPEVFGYTAYFGGLEALKCGSDEVERTGHAILMGGLSSIPAPLMHRFRLKLPKGMADMESPDAKVSRFPNFQTSILKLLKLKFPEAYRLCCS